MFPDALHDWPYNDGEECGEWKMKLTLEEEVKYQ
jgi:hypothetical protein